MITDEQLKSWEQEGMLILPGFYSGDDLDAVDRAMRDVWSRRDSRVVVDDLLTQRRCLVSALSDEERTHRFKTNDLYLTEPTVRELAMGERMAPVLKALLGDTPVLCNSLNFDQGSTQGAHIDSLYMTPITPGHLCAIWVALEDVSPEAGPLFFFRGSHNLPRHKFSDGTYHAIEAEMPAWHARTDQALIDASLPCETFLAKRGDVFIWSSDLVHGGSAITDPEKTRKSVVFHYFSKHDCDKLGWKMQPMNVGYWIDRPRQPVPEDAPEAAVPVLEPAVAAEIKRLQDRVHKLEQELVRQSKDPYRFKLAAARARKWARQKLGPGAKLPLVRELLRVRP